MTRIAARLLPGELHSCPGCHGDNAGILIGNETAMGVFSIILINNEAQTEASLSKEKCNSKKGKRAIKGGGTHRLWVQLPGHQSQQICITHGQRAVGLFIYREINGFDQQNRHTDWTDKPKLHYALFSLFNLRSERGRDDMMCTISASFEQKKHSGSEKAANAFKVWGGGFFFSFFKTFNPAWKRFQT